MNHDNTHIIREFPYMFDGLYTIGSDCDACSYNFLVKFHQLININLGMNISNSLWIYSYTNSTNDITLFHSPNICLPNISTYSGFNSLNKSLSNQIIDHYHRGDLDHTHSWYNDNVKSNFKIISEPNVLKDNIYHILINNSISDKGLIYIKKSGDKYDNQYYIKHKDLKINKYDTKKETPHEIVYNINNNYTNNSNKFIGNTINLFVNAKCILKNIEMILDNKSINFTQKMIKDASYYTDDYCIISLLCENITFKSIELKIKSLTDFKIYYINFDSFNETIYNIQKKVLDNYNISFNYLSEHGGNTHNVRIDHLSASRSFPYKYIKDSEFEFITGIPSVIDTDNNYISIVKNSLFKKGSESKFFTGAVVPINNTTFFETNQYKLLLKKYKTNPQLGSNIILSILYILNKFGNTLFWYTHIGTCETEFKELNLNIKIYPEEYEYYFKKLSNLYYNFEDNTDYRIFICSAASYVKYITIKKEILSNIKFKDNCIHINSWYSNESKKLRLDGRKWSSDLSFITIYTEYNNSRLFINNKEYFNFYRNNKDKTGKYSITILDITSKTTLISNAPFVKSNVIKNININWSINSNVSINPKGLKFIISKKSLHSFIKIKLDNVYSYNTSHIGLKINTNISNMKYNIILNIKKKDYFSNNNVYQRIALIKNDKSVDSYFNTNVITDSINEIYIPIHTIKFKNKSYNNLPLPIGIIDSYEIHFYESNIGDYIEISDLSLYRPNPNFKNGDLIISGVIKKHNMEYINNLNVRLVVYNKSPIVTNTINGRFNFKLPYNSVYRIKFNYNNISYTKTWSIATKNESEINFIV